MVHPIPLKAPPDDACLGFVNTRYWRGSAKPTETLQSLDDLLAWTATAPGWPAPEGLTAAARRGWRAGEGGETAAFTGLIALREILFRLLAAAASGAPPPAADLAAFNTALEQAPPRNHLAASGDAYAIAPIGSAPAALLAPALWSAADLLAGRRRDGLRQCANPDCGYLFLDDSKSGNRRWCAMSACGNRAKARRHYQKVREEKGRK